jgi:hypothetical protein
MNPVGTKLSMRSFHSFAFRAVNWITRRSIAQRQRRGMKKANYLMIPSLELRRYVRSDCLLQQLQMRPMEVALHRHLNHVVSIAGQGRGDRPQVLAAHIVMWTSWRT